jgi:hypothetical protein
MSSDSPRLTLVAASGALVLVLSALFVGLDLSCIERGAPLDTHVRAREGGRRKAKS